MQVMSITYDVGLPMPYVLLEFDGYIQVQANPGLRARFPLWLLEIMQNDILGHVPLTPRAGVPVLPADHYADVIDITARRVRAV